MVGAHQIDVFQLRSVADNRPNADDAAVEAHIGKDAAVGDNRVFDGATVQLGSRQIARFGKDRRQFVVKIECRQRIRQHEVGFEERRDGSDVCPIAVKKVAVQTEAVQCHRNNILAEVV